MKKRFSHIIAFSMTLSVSAAVFTGCGEGDYESSSSYDYVPQESQEQWDTADESEDYFEAGDAELSEEYDAYDVPSQEEYSEYIEEGFKDPKAEPLSTFSADVDTASYSNARRFLENYEAVPENAVRAEEFINYFDYCYDNPSDGETFGQYIELTDCPWNPKTKLMMLGIQGDRMEDVEMPPSNLVFLIDSSGSMSDYNKLPLVQTAFSMLAENLTENDRISIVTYAGSSETLIKGASSKQKNKIVETLYSITASGGTNGEGGIETAYELAEEYFIKGGNNRIILATDGDLNIGASTEDELVKLIESKRDKGIYLSVLGFGTDNYKDNKLEAIADNGNGNYSYIDSVDEARRVLVEEMSGTLFTIAKDVKIQVEFNPAQIKSYRLIGYDNRLMNAEDFYDNTKDAGEVGAGHSVTALYEVELANDSGTYHGVSLEFAEEHSQPEEDNETTGRTELCKLSVAYKDIGTNQDIYRSKLFGMEKYSDKPSERIQLAGAAAEFAMLLRNSGYKGTSNFDHVIKTVTELEKSDFYKADANKLSELSELAEIAYSIYN